MEVFASLFLHTGRFLSVPLMTLGDTVSSWDDDTVSHWGDDKVSHWDVVQRLGAGVAFDGGIERTECDNSERRLTDEVKTAANLKKRTVGVIV